jgi:hypothetical protein
MCKFLFVVLASNLAFSSAAQTGRVAYFSRGGASAALEAGERKEDNFGTPMVFPKALTRLKWKVDTITFLNDSMAVHRGLMMAYYNDGKPAAGWQRAVEVIQRIEGVCYADESVIPNSRGRALTFSSLREWYPTAVVVGADKLKKAVPKKPSGYKQAFPKRPFQYSYWRGLAGAAALGAVGWLLGKKRAA